jgi:hypothetical protein
MAVFWVVAPCSLVDYQTTQCYNPEDSHLHTHRRENLKSYLLKPLFVAHAVKREADTINVNF